MANDSTVEGTVSALRSLASFELDVHSERCVRVRNRHASCSRCFDACTSGALSLAGCEVAVKPELCVGCGTCATVCPTCALEAQHPNDAALLAAARRASERTGGRVAFACHDVLERDEGKCDRRSMVAVTCLSRLEESIVVALFSEGVSEIAMVHGSCETCPRSQGIVSARLVKETVGTLVRAWGLDRSCTLDGTVPSWACARAVVQEPAEEREDGLAATVNDLVHRAGVSMASSGFDHVMEDGTLPHFVPVRRIRLLDLLASFGDPAVERLETRLWGHVTIDLEACRSCRMCAVFCPTGALTKFQDEDGTMGIEHYAAECVHCCLCEDICPEHAIVSESSVPALQLARGETERYEMPEPAWHTGPDQILRKMRPQIGGNEVRHSY